MRYHHFQQQSPDSSLAACLESIIKLRKIFEPSQKEILAITGKDNTANLESVQEVLQKYLLKARHRTPFPTKQQTNKFLGEELKSSQDLIVYRNLEHAPRHYSLIEKYNSEQITLLDPAQERKQRLVILPDELFESMALSNPGNAGFYVIEDNSRSGP